MIQCFILLLFESDSTYRKKVRVCPSRVVHKKKKKQKPKTMIVTLVLCLLYSEKVFKLQEKETKSDSIRDRKIIQEQVLFYLIGAVENFNGLNVLLKNAMLMNSIELPQMPLRSVTGAIKYICDDFKLSIRALIQCLLDVFENLAYQYSWAITQLQPCIRVSGFKECAGFKEV